MVNKQKLYKLKRVFRFKMVRFISFLGEGQSDKNLLGNKGAKLDELVKLGMPVPQGFTLTTEAYRAWVREGGISSAIEQEIKEALSSLEERSALSFGGREKPLFVSVRSGASVSMPGMLETISNVGATDPSIAGLADQYQNTEFAYQTYRAFMHQYMEIIHGERPAFGTLAKEIIFPVLLLYLSNVGNYELKRFLNYIRNGKNIELASSHNSPEYWLNKERVFQAMLAEGVRLTGSAVKKFNYEQDTFRSGKIARITEDGIKVLFEGDTFEEIPFKYLDFKEKKKILDLSPEILQQAEAYLAERSTVGQFAPDTLRIRRALTDIPDDPFQQLLSCVQGVFCSWNGNKAREYRDLHKIPSDLGTAVTIQRMIFGNIGNESGTAVCFSSSPNTGERELHGEFLLGHQGESLVSGNISPKPISELESGQPKVYSFIDEKAAILEQHFGRPQDIEVTWETPDAVYILQTRDAVLNPSGNVGYVLREYKKGKLTEREVIQKITLADLESLANRTVVDVLSGMQPLTKGKSILNGVVIGKVATTIDEVMALQESPVIYCAQKTSTEDIRALRNAAAFLTAQGGEYSHAGVVARQLQRIAVVGCENMRVQEGSVQFGEHAFRSGALVTVNGYDGSVYKGVLETRTGRASPEVAEVVRIARELVGKLPVVYEVHCVDDIAGISMTNGSRILYCYDFDCLTASGVLDDIKHNKKDLNKEIKMHAKKTYLALHEKLRSNPIILQWNGKYNTTLDERGVDHVYVRQQFVDEFMKRASKEKASVEKEPLGLKNGENVVIVRPWAIEESYFIAAKGVIQ